MPELRMAYGYPIARRCIIADLYLIYRFKKAKWF